MREIPILFSTPMVQAILAGNKSMTRRVVKNKVFQQWIDAGMSDEAMKNPDNNWIDACPYGQAGDILWVRETWCELWEIDGNDQTIEGTEKYYYAADNPTFPFTGFLRDDGTYKDYPAWRPSIHMPRSVARIFLEVTNVRVERVQDITEEDAITEGTSPERALEIGGEQFTPTFYDPDGQNVRPNYKDAFSELWDSINERRGFSFQSNPWVFVVSFEVAK
jgi:hypothetical protein